MTRLISRIFLNEIAVSERFPSNAVFVFEATAEFCAAGPFGLKEKTLAGCLNESFSGVNHLKPSGHYTYHQFNVQQFCVLPTHCIYVFCVDLRTNSDYFPIQNSIPDGMCLPRGTDWAF